MSVPGSDNTFVTNLPTQKGEQSSVVVFGARTSPTVPTRLFPICTFLLIEDTAEVLLRCTLNWSLDGMGLDLSRRVNNMYVFKRA